MTAKPGACEAFREALSKKSLFFNALAQKVSHAKPGTYAGETGR